MRFTKLDFSLDSNGGIMVDGENNESIDQTNAANRLKEIVEDDEKMVALCKQLVVDYGDQLRAEAAKELGPLLDLGDITGLVLRNSAKAILIIADTGETSPKKVLDGVTDDLLKALTLDMETEKSISEMFGVPTYLMIRGAYYYSRAFPGQFEIVETMYLFPCRLLLEEDCEIHTDRPTKYAASADHFRIALICNPMANNGYPEALSSASGDLLKFMIEHKINMIELRKLIQDYDVFVSGSIQGKSVSGFLGDAARQKLEVVMDKLGTPEGVSRDELIAFMQLAGAVVAGHLCVLANAGEQDWRETYAGLLHRLQTLIYSSRKREA